MGKCVKNEIWTSTLRGNPDGKFVIKDIDAAGHFTGDHDGDRISGQCTVNGIWFVREGVKRSYSGLFESENKILGAATLLATPEVRKLLPIDDDWVATHT